MTVKLSSLRVTAEMDVSSYTRGMAQKVGADLQGAASAKAVGTALGQVDAAAQKTGEAAAKLSRQWVEGYAQAARFEKAVRAVGGAVDQGMDLERAAVQLDSIYRKFGLTADAAALARQGFVSIAPVVENLNRHYAEQTQILARQTAETQRLADAEQARLAMDQRIRSYTSAYEEFGRTINDLRAKYDPLFAAERAHAEKLREIDLVYSVLGKDTDAYAAALRRANMAHDAAVRSISASTVEVGLNGRQWTNLGYQINDVATMMLSGASPFQIMATQGGQVVQILQEGQGGIGGSLKSIGAQMLALLTPTRLVIGGVAAIGVGAVAAYASWINAQAEVQRSLLGLGRASGATVAQINAIAEAYAAAGKVSVSSARQMASAFSATGQISPDLFGDAIASAKDFALILGVDTSDAAAKLAAALADPTRGVEQLNQTLGAFDAATVRRIQSLDAQNRLTEAQRQIIEGVRNATQGAEQATTAWSRTWDDLGMSISNVWSRLGQAIDAATGNAPLEAQKAGLEARLKQIEDARASEAEHLQQLQKWGYSNDQIDAEIPSLKALNGMYAEVTGSLQRVNDQLEKAAQKAKDAKEALASLKMMGTINIVMPELNIRQQLEDRAVALAAMTADPLAQAKQGITQEQAVLAAGRANEAAKSYLTTQETTTKQLELQNRAITARSPAERASIAYQQKMLELSGQNVAPAEKERQAQLAYNNALKEGTFALSEQARERLRAADDAVAQARLETQLVGATTQQRELALANLKTEQDLRREAAQNGTSLDQAQLAALKAKNAELARQNQMLREAQALDNLMFDRSQLGRTQAEQSVASMLRSNGMPIDFSSPIAQLALMNEHLRETRDLMSSAASGFAQDIMNGVGAGEAFSNMLKRVASQLMDMAVNQLVAQAFGGTSGGGLGGVLGLLGIGGGGTVGATTGATFVAGAHSGGLPGFGEATFFRMDHPALYANAPRFHTGRDPYGLLPGEMRAIIKNDEGVFTAAQMRALGQQMSMSKAAGAGAGRAGPAVAVNVQTLPGTTADVGNVRQNSDGSLSVDVVMRAVKDELISDFRNMGPVASTVRGRFGLNPMKGV
ncbi:phage tail length tape measure family protein [Xanthobacter sediminis]